MPAGTRITLPSGRVVTLPKAWSKMTIADLAKIGIRPGLGGHGRIGKAGFVPMKSLSGTLRTGAVSAGPNLPLTSHVCEGSPVVCTYIWGSGGAVDEWETTAEYDGNTELCTIPTFWLPANTIFYVGAEFCASEPGYFYDVYPQYFEINHVWDACNTWVHWRAKPCVGIDG